MGIELDEAGRQILSQTLNSVITVYDPRRGMNVDMKVIDVLDSGIPRTAPKNEPSPDGTAIMPDDDAIVERDRNKREMEPDESEETHSYDPSSDADPSGKPVKPAEERTRKGKRRHRQNQNRPPRPPIRRPGDDETRNGRRPMVPSVPFK